MSIKQLIRDVYEGIYYIAIKYESDPSKSTIVSRFFATWMA